MVLLIRKKHLLAAVTGLYPLFRIADLLLPQGTGAVAQGVLPLPRQRHRVAAKRQDTAQPLRNGQIDAALWHAAVGYGAAVRAAVSCVQNDYLPCASRRTVVPQREGNS